MIPVNDVERQTGLPRLFFDLDQQPRFAPVGGQYFIIERQMVDFGLCTALTLR